jgi:CRISPR/Cas system CSM-associated protein Csm3 (group 7 of RAMP superfamily)
MSVDKGILRLSKKGAPQIEIVTKKGKQALLNPPREEISQTLRDKLKELDGQQVEFELVGGQPKRIREVGGTFVVAGASGAAAGGGSQRDPQSSNQPQRQRDGARTGGGGGGQRHFHNPYNFVPAPPRKTSDPDLGDHRPVSQGSFEPARYSGRIGVRMVAEAPLLVPDTENAEESCNGHKTFPLRLGADGKPSIPASSIRGMLRSAYETVTNSRFGKFSDEHKTKLKYRQSKKPYKNVDYPASPWDLLPASLRPATSLDELSPADRVFGWVRAEREGQGAGAVRGLLRVGPVTCTSTVENSVETFCKPGVPLAILSAPKPQQGRFYVAEDQSGQAQQDGLSKADAGYAPEKGLRGRKVYPHQLSLPQDHWQHPTEDRTQTGTGSPTHHQEYRRPQRDGEEQRDDQNRSVLGWVKPDAEFRVDLHVHNLSQVEFGALLWLLSLPDDHFHRFGGGKPLGFGSVRLEVEDLDVRTGDDLLDRYSGWTTGGGGADPREASMDAFRSAILLVYPADGHASFEEVPFIRAFLAACRGHADPLPIHYPRATENGQPGPPSPEGESFRWFVENERSAAPHSLRDLAGDEGLPVLTSSSRGGGRGGQQQQRGGQGHDRGGRR